MARSHNDHLTTAEREELRQRRLTAILTVLEKERLDDRRAMFQMTPNEIGWAIQVGHDIPVKTPFTHSGKKLGPGSSISFTLQSMERRGWIHWETRSDGLSGTAYYITDEGRAELRRRQEVGREV